MTTTCTMLLRLKYLRPALLTITLLGGMAVRSQYTVGDYGAVASGNWNNAVIWNTWNGSAWVGPAAVPPASANAWILAGRTVSLPSPGPYSINNLVVETGAKLWTTNTLVNVYLNVFGSTLRCDGTIGDGSTFDGISFNIEGANVTILGNGTLDCSRLRKSSITPNATATSEPSRSSRTTP